MAKKKSKTNKKPKVIKKKSVGKILKKNKKVKVVLPKVKSKKLKAVEEVQKPARLYSENDKLELQKLSILLGNTYARQFLVDLGGENTLALMKNFCGAVSDDELSKKLKVKISDVRATLNKLHSEGLVSYVREKDNETGWFSYSWSLNRQKIESWVSIKMKEKNLVIDMKNFDNYFCPSCGLESILKFEHAAACNFKCQKCERNMEFIESEKVVQDLILGSR